MNKTVREALGFLRSAGESHTFPGMSELTGMVIDSLESSLGEDILDMEMEDE